VGRDRDVRQVEEGRVEGKRFWVGDVEDRVEPAARALDREGIGVEEGAARGVDDRGAVTQHPELALADHVDRLGQRGCVEGEHVDRRKQLVERDESGSGCGEGRGIRVGIGDEHLGSVELLQERDHSTPDAREADDAHAALEVRHARRVEQRAPLATVRAGVAGEVLRALPGEHDRREGELGDRDRVRLGGRGDEDAAIPERLADHRPHGAGAMEDGLQVRHPVEALRRERGRAPRGEEHLDGCEPVGQVGVVEVSGCHGVGHFAQRAQPGEPALVEEGGERVGPHRDERGRSRSVSHPVVSSSSGAPVLRRAER
jgi:hypothetical protein